MRLDALSETGQPTANQAANVPTAPSRALRRSPDSTARATVAAATSSSPGSGVPPATGDT